MISAVYQLNYFWWLYLVAIEVLQNGKFQHHVKNFDLFSSKIIKFPLYYNKHSPKNIQQKKKTQKANIKPCPVISTNSG